MSLCFWVGAWLPAVEPYTPVTADPMLEPWRWRHITELDGKGFRCMTEAPDGSMWFGVAHGALNYDGLKWKFYGKEDGLILPSVDSIVSTADGDIYAASIDRIYRFREGRWEDFFSQKGFSRSITLIKPIDGGVWAATRFGLLRIKSDSLILYTGKEAIKQGSPKLHPGTKIVYLPGELDLDDSFRVKDVHEDVDGNLWLLVNFKYVVRYSPTSGDWTKYPCSDGIHIMRTGGRKIWVVQLNNEQRQQYQLFEYDLDNWKGSLINLERVGGEGFCSGFLRTRDDTLWVYGRKYLQAYRGKTPFAAASGIFDGEYVEDRWQVYEYPDKSEDRISMYEVSDGSLWVAKRMGQVYRVDRSQAEWLTYKGLNFQAESSAATNPDGKAVRWYITVEGAVVNQVVETDAWSRYDVDDGLISNPVVVSVTKSGRAWAAGSHEGGAATAVFNGNAWTRHLHPNCGWTIDYRSLFQTSDGKLLFKPSSEPPPEIVDDYVQVELPDSPEPRFTYINKNRAMRDCVGIAQAADGTVWFSGEKLLISDGEKVEERSSQILAPMAWVDAIDSDPSGQIWASVGGTGVFRFDGREWTRYTTAEGLGDMMASTIRCARDGTVWAATPQGISRFDGRSWTPQVIGEGFPGFVRESGTLREAGDGGLWINYASRDWYFRAKSGTNYTSSSLPEFRTTLYRPRHRAPPETEITMSIDRVSQPGNTILTWTGISPWKAASNEALNYSWRIGNGEWSLYSPEKARTFLALPPGKHTFEVRARDLNFNTDPSPSVVSFTVIAPLWRQAWFILSIILFVGMLSLFGYVLIRHHEQQLVAREQQKVEIERMKLRLFTDISHELRTPLSVIPHPIERAIKAIEDSSLKKYLSVALRNVHELQHLVDQILDLRKIQEGQMKFYPVEMELVRQTGEVIESFQILADLKGIQLEFESEIEAIQVLFDPHALMRILGNLISNAIKFTPQDGKVRVRLKARPIEAEPSKKWLIKFEVEDNGAGVSPDQHSQIFESYYTSSPTGSDKTQGAGIGLTLTLDILKQLGGTITVASPVSSDAPAGSPGTRFEVELPLAVVSSGIPRKS